MPSLLLYALFPRVKQKELTSFTIYEENKLAFKNITDTIIDQEDDKLIPICPHCGHNTKSE